MKYRFTDLQLAGNKQVKDAQALLDLLNEHYKSSVLMAFTHANKGRANIIAKRFTIPQHALDKGETYLHYYVIHEFTHCLGFFDEHNLAFKRKEQTLLAMFGISIDYAKSYPRALYCNGEKVYQKKPVQSIGSLKHEHIYSKMVVKDGIKEKSKKG